MRTYRRWHEYGGTYFFTLVTHQRRPILASSAMRAALREAIATEQRAHPFELDAIVLLPDHLHLLLTLPPGDDGYAARLGRIKADCTRRFLAAGGKEAPIPCGMRNGRHRGVWQTRYWEHLIRDERDMEEHEDYVHYNPVKHGLVRCPHDWPYSTFHRLVRTGRYESRWSCSCKDDAPPPSFSRLKISQME